jgi:hypothetical protein
MQPQGGLHARGGDGRDGSDDGLQPGGGLQGTDDGRPPNVRTQAQDSAYLSVGGGQSGFQSGWLQNQWSQSGIGPGDAVFDNQPPDKLVVYVPNAVDMRGIAMQFVFCDCDTIAVDWIGLIKQTDQVD